MMTGIYAGAAASDAFERQHEALAANLANIQTPGYRRRVQSFTNLEQKGGSTAGVGIKVPQYNHKISFTPGDLQPTGTKLDVALLDSSGRDGNAFFTVGHGDGGERYTRNGRMAVDQQNRLIHASSGRPMLNANGSPIRLNRSGGEVDIDAAGKISQDGTVLGQLKVVAFGRTDLLQPVESGLYMADDANTRDSVVGRIQVKQGFIESSNTRSVEEMVKMMANYRSYEATQRVIKQMDQSVQGLLRKISS